MEYPRNSHGRGYEVVYHVLIPVVMSVWAENTNGEIAVDSMANDVIVDLTNGNVELNGITGDLDLDLTNGNVTLQEVQGSAHVDLTNGRIYGEVVLPDQGVCDLETVNGDIDLDIPEGTSADFSASVANGAISLTGLALTNSTFTNRSAQGTLGGGDGTIRMRTVNGNIRVTGK